MSATQIHQHLDEPERILVFTPDEFILVIVVAIIGFAMGHLLLGLGGAFLAWQLVQKAKAGLSLRRLLGRMYWILPPVMLGMKRSPDSVFREWVG
tara:strand:- start:530 stop:814 length:285 start_codon:yes stop_codon:yes gene_type:complete